MKYATSSCVVRWSRGTTVLKAGDSIEDDNALVLERPELFTDEPPGPQVRTPGGPPRVETVTRAPGEVRGAGPAGRRGGKSAAGE